MPKKYFFRIYLPAFLFSSICTEVLDRIFNLARIKENIIKIYPNWVGFIMEKTTYIFLSLTLFILGCIFMDKLPSLWEKSSLNKINNIDKDFIAIKRFLFILLFSFLSYLLIYPFTESIIKSWDVNFSLGDTLEGIISGVFLALAFFFLREKVFGYPDLNDKWYLMSVTEETVYNPFKNMILHHELFLVQDKSQIKGTAEKYYEDSSVGKGGDHVIHYIAKHRRRANIEGTIQKNYFGPDILILHAVENGEVRQSTIYCRIELKRKYLIGQYDFSRKGTFYSMVSGQKGYVILSKQRFQTRPACIDPKFSPPPRKKKHIFSKLLDK